MQTITKIQKTETRQDTQYDTSTGFLIVNGTTGELTLGFNNSDNWCGCTSLGAGLKAINWNDKAETTEEYISWIKE